IGVLVAIYEDGGEAYLRPLTLTRPAYALRCGASLIYEKVLASVEGQLIFYVRGSLLDVAREKLGRVSEVRALSDVRTLDRGEDLLLINGRWLFDRDLLELEEGVAVKDGEPTYAFIGRRSIEAILRGCGSIIEALEKAGRELGEREVAEAKLVRYPWDLVRYNRLELERDLEVLRRLKQWDKPRGEGVYMVGDREDIMVSGSARIYPCVVLDSTQGPIIVDDDAVIFPHSYIAGPCYIGRGSWIVGGRISSSSIGPMCRVGGEVEETIFQGFSNKYHAGFVGHSYVGEWVNLGALTTTSDLKNDYSVVRAPAAGKLVDTGMIKVGAFIGDHTKTSIGSLLSTGSVIGVMCNLVTSGEPYPKYIPSFTWYIRGRVWDWITIDQMMEAAERMMARRGAVMSEAEKRLYRDLYDETREERGRFAESLLTGRRGLCAKG
ncbi:MAG: putative sugar nucleotidyl transferase, partial [Nitrososphaerota archaeon]